MRRRLHEDVHWITNCFESSVEHLHLSLYLIENDDEYVLVDTGSHYFEEAVHEEIYEVTGEDFVDSIIISHPDLAHTGNFGNIIERSDDVNWYSASSAPELVGLAGATTVEMGGSMEISGRTLEFAEGPLADLLHTIWVYDPESGTLFTADGFCTYHNDGQCRQTSAELEDGFDAAQVDRYTRETFKWLKYVEPETLRDALTTVLETYDVSYIAPIHGHPIASDDVDAYVDAFMASVERAATDPEIEIY
jgi:flavorubredoxin